MAILLSSNAYGKNAVNLSKIIRHEDHHEFRQISVNVSLQGDFETVYTQGNNEKVLATDTQKNTVYALAKDHFNGSIEEFALYLSGFFLDNNPQVSAVTIEIAERAWTRMLVNGTLHPHAYISGGNEQHTAKVIRDRSGTQVTAGIRDLLILKTTDSAFENFIREQYTTLKETDDRIFSTQCQVEWQYALTDMDFQQEYLSIRNILLETFARHHSLSVQQTLYAMGEAVLQAKASVKTIHLAMPNKHHIPFNLDQFGMENRNDIFIATDEPYGYITGTLQRG